MHSVGKDEVNGRVIVGCPGNNGVNQADQTILVVCRKVKGAQALVPEVRNGLSLFGCNTGAVKSLQMRNFSERNRGGVALCQMKG